MSRKHIIRTRTPLTPEQEALPGIWKLTRADWVWITIDGMLHDVLLFTYKRRRPRRTREDMQATGR